MVKQRPKKINYTWRWIKETAQDRNWWSDPADSLCPRQFKKGKEGWNNMVLPSLVTTNHSNTSKQSRLTRWLWPCLQEWWRLTLSKYFFTNTTLLLCQMLSEEKKKSTTNFKLNYLNFKRPIVSGKWQKKKKRLYLLKTVQWNTKQRKKLIAFCVSTERLYNVNLGMAFLSTTIFVWSRTISLNVSTSTYLISYHI